MTSLSANPRPNKRMKASEVKNGEFMSATVYYRVHRRGSTSVSVYDQSLGHGPREGFNTLNYGNAVMERECHSARQFSKENVNKLSATDLVHVLQNAGDTVFTAWFTKKNGDLRKIVCFRCPGKTDTCFGRTEVIDLEIDTYSHAVKNSDGEVVHAKGANFAPDIGVEEKHKYQKRLIDHRELKAIIIRNELHYLKSLSKKKIQEMIGETI